MCARPAGAIKPPSECSVCTESRVSKPDSVSKGGPKLWSSWQVTWMNAMHISPCRFHPRFARSVGLSGCRVVDVDISHFG
ncbi:hypothetical protein NXS19_003863 [Fusarium pseudograminearum]|nr:hypothetical protein NXS19_003863 [Fusarium pseudograminearum]